MSSVIQGFDRADWVALFQNLGLGLPTDETFAEMQSAIEQGLGEQAIRTTFADYFTSQPDATLDNLAETIQAMLELGGEEGIDFDRALQGDTAALLQQINQSEGTIKTLLDKNKDSKVDEEELAQGLELFDGLRRSIEDSDGLLAAVFDTNQDGEIDDQELQRGLRLFDVTGDGKIESGELELLVYLISQGRGLNGEPLNQSFPAGLPIPSQPGRNLGSLNGSPGQSFQSQPASWGNQGGGAPASTTTMQGDGTQPAYYRGARGPTPTSVESGNQHHITQFTNADFNPNGPAGSKNCGPASLAIAMSAAGAMPEGLDPEQKVDFARALMYGATYTPGGDIPMVDADQQTTSIDQIVAGANNAGLPAESAGGFEALDAALESGKTVVAYGNISGAWRDQFAGVQVPGAAEVRYGSGGGGHFIAITGKTEDGRYIVSDPMFTGGAVAMTAEQLQAFNETPGFAAIG